MKKIFFVLCIFFITPIINDTLFSHISSGRALLEAPSEIGQDPVSFTTKETVNVYWLYDIFVFVIFSTLGKWGMYLLPGIIWVTSFYLTFFRKPLLEQIFLFFLTTTAIFPIISNQNHISVFIFCALLVEFLRHDRKIIYFALLQIFWVNTHPSFLFCPLAIFVYLWGQHQFRRAIHLSCVTLICSFFSPYTYKIWQPALEHCLSSNLYLWAWPGIWLLVATFVWESIQNKKISPLLWSFAVAGISLVFSDWIIIFVLLLGVSLRKSFISVRVVSVVAFSVLSFIQLTFFWEYSSIEIIEFDTKVLTQNIYNDPAIGGHLSWKSQKPIFVDERSVYSPIIKGTSERIRYEPNHFDKVTTLYDIQSIVLDHSLLLSKDLCGWLSVHPDWSLVHCDANIAVYLKNIPANQNAILKWKIEDDVLQNYKKQNIKDTYRIAQFYFQIDYIEAGKYIWETINKDSLEYHLLSSYIANNEGDLEKAAATLSKYIKKKNDNLPELQFLVATYLRLNSSQYLAEAKKWLDYGLSKYPDDPELYIYKAQFFHLQEDIVSTLETLRVLIKKHPLYEKARQYDDSLKETQIGSENKFLKQGRMLFQQGQKKRALKRFEHVLSVDNNNLEAHIEIGKIYHNLKRYDEAQEHYNHVLRLASENKEAISLLAITLSAIGKWEEAKKLIDPISEDDAAYVQGAVSVVNAKIIEEMKKQIRSDPNDIKAIVRLCKILSKEKRFGEALFYYKKVAKPDPKFLADLLFEEGKQQLNNKLVEEGLKLIYESLEKNPNHLEAHLLIGTVALKKKEWNIAEKHYKKVKKIDSSDLRSKEGMALIELGKGYEKQAKNQLQQSIEHFQQFVALSSDLEERKRIEQRVKDLKKSLQNFRLIKIKLLYDQGENAMRRKNYDLAINKYKEIINIIENAPKSHYLLGFIYTQRKEFDTAISYLENALKYKPNFGKAHFLLSQLYYKIGKTELSQKHFDLYSKYKEK